MTNEVIEKSQNQLRLTFRDLWELRTQTSTLLAGIAKALGYQEANEDIFQRLEKKESKLKRHYKKRKQHYLNGQQLIGPHKKKASEVIEAKEKEAFEQATSNGTGNVPERQKQILELFHKS